MKQDQPKLTIISPGRTPKNDRFFSLETGMAHTGNAHNTPAEMAPISNTNDVKEFSGRRRRHKTLVFKSVLSVMLTCLSYFVQANNIQITNVSILSDSTNTGWATIQFNLTWDNSWYLTTAPSNYDAAWIFIKWRQSGSSDVWKHVYLRNGAGYHNVTSSGSPWGAIEVGNLITSASGYDGTNNLSNPGMGVFVRRSAAQAGAGNTPSLTVNLRWYYNDDFNGTTISSTGLGSGAQQTDIKVDGIEMVNVPTGPFYLGSGGSENYPFYLYPTTTNPYLVNSAGTINVGATAGYLNFASSGAAYGGDPSGNIPATFPNGYNSFYCMKYELSMQQYVDFLNSIPPASAAAFGYLGNYDRYNLSKNGLVFSTTVPYLAASFITTEALLAFLDWSALRPMTELEYEKACRGSKDATTANAVVPNEFAWGTNGGVVSLTAVSNANAVNEASATANANIVTGNAFGGTSRVGIFATSTSNRISSGGSYYGIMEMSGNVWERVISVGTTSALSFTGIHGDGIFSTHPANWPAGKPSYNGYGFRGGSFVFGAPYITVSDRTSASFISANNNDFQHDWSGRGVRTK